MKSSIATHSDTNLLDFPLFLYPYHFILAKVLVGI